MQKNFKPVIVLSLMTSNDDSGEMISVARYHTETFCSKIY